MSKKKYEAIREKTARWVYTQGMQFDVTESQAFKDMCYEVRPLHAHNPPYRLYGHGAKASLNQTRLRIHAASNNNV
jgi:hypothetical protein